MSDRLCDQIAAHTRTRRLGGDPAFLGRLRFASFPTSFRAPLNTVVGQASELLNPRLRAHARHNFCSCVAFTDRHALRPALTEGEHSGISLAVRSRMACPLRHFQRCCSRWPHAASLWRTLLRPSPPPSTSSRNNCAAVDRKPRPPCSTISAGSSGLITSRSAWAASRERPMVLEGWNTIPPQVPRSPRRFGTAEDHRRRTERRIGSGRGPPRAPLTLKLLVLRHRGHRLCALGRRHRGAGGAFDRARRTTDPRRAAKVRLRADETARSRRKIYARLVQRLGGMREWIRDPACGLQRLGCCRSRTRATRVHRVFSETWAIELGGIRGTTEPARLSPKFCVSRAHTLNFAAERDRGPHTHKDSVL